MIKNKGAKKLWIEYLNSEGVKCKEMIIITYVIILTRDEKSPAYAGLIFNH